MNGDMQTWRGLEDRRGHVDAVRENSTRPGRAWATHQTTGVGHNIDDTVIKFGCGFLEMPIFTFGVVFDMDPQDFPADDPPRCTAGVYDWKVSAQGLYVGAYCWFVVDSYTQVNPTALKMLFTLSWEGVASKDFLSATGFPVSALDA